jgi:hypothetical protein
MEGRNRVNSRLLFTSQISKLCTTPWTAVDHIKNLVSAARLYGYGVPSCCTFPWHRFEIRTRLPSIVPGLCRGCVDEPIQGSRINSLRASLCDTDGATGLNTVVLRQLYSARQQYHQQKLLKLRQPLVQRVFTRNYNQGRGHTASP